MSVVQVFLGRPRDLLPSIFPSMSCSCDKLCLIRCPKYCNFVVLNCLTISLLVPILLNTSSLVIFSVHDMFSTLRFYIITSWLPGFARAPPSHPPLPFSLPPSAPPFLPPSLPPSRLPPVCPSLFPSSDYPASSRIFV